MGSRLCRLPIVTLLCCPAASARATDRAIREHPYESIGIAFGVGVLIGVLINRK